jgi:hypothetical protein
MQYSIVRQLDKYQRALLAQAVKFYLQGFFTFDELLAETWYIKSFFNAAYDDASSDH